MCCSDDRARRVSEARAQRAEEYRHSRQSHAVRLQAAERAAAAEAAEDGAAPDSGPGQIILIVKADVQVRWILQLCSWQHSGLLLRGCALVKACKKF